MATDVLLFIAGLAALFLGGESLVRGASRLARILGINPVVIGLTVVAFGTSAPEFVVCLIAAFNGSSDIVMGNIVGSNITNIGLILGVSAVISPIFIQIKLVKAEAPIMIALSVVLYLLSLNLGIGRIEGAILFSALVAVCVYSYYGARREPYRVEEEYKEFIGTGGGIVRQCVFIAAGLAALVIGARLVVNSAISIAESFGVSELIISITAVAIGTSLPELSTSVIAAVRKEHDIVAGNIIGSNVFNLGILGLVSVIHPVGVNPGLTRFELPVMIFFAVLVLPVMITGRKVSRLEGLLLLSFYGGFLVLLLV